MCRAIHNLTFFCLIVSAWPSPVTGNDERDAFARKVFLAVEHIRTSDAAQQAKSIRHLYQDLVPEVFFSEHSRSCGALLFNSVNGGEQDRDAPSAKPALTPEQVVDKLMAREGWTAVMDACRQSTSQLLKRHPHQLEPLIEADLDSVAADRLHRALFVIGELGLTSFFDETLQVFRQNDEMSSRAAQTLRDLNDPRAIGPLVLRNPGDPVEHLEIIANLQEGRFPDPAVLALLNHRSSEVRWRATYMLAESGDSSLTPHAIRLMRDTSPEVRRHAAVMAYFLKGEEVDRVRPDLVHLLSDSDVDVRVDVACLFADRKDRVCAPTLLELVRNEKLDERTHSRIVQAIHRLTDSYFGYYVGSDGWKPSTLRNRAAVSEFAKWVSEHIDEN